MHNVPAREAWIQNQKEELFFFLSKKEFRFCFSFWNNNNSKTNQIVTEQIEILKLQFVRSHQSNLTENNPLSYLDKILGKETRHRFIVRNKSTKSTSGLLQTPRKKQVELQKSFSKTLRGKHRSWRSNREPRLRARTRKHGKHPLNTSRKRKEDRKRQKARMKDKNASTF